MLLHFKKSFLQKKIHFKENVLVIWKIQDINMDISTDLSTSVKSV